jgi:multicomponent Na+:H+ antiporter subunit E
MKIYSVHLTLNLALALIWLFLSADPGIPAFLIGFVVGFLLLAIFRPILDSGSYVRRTLGLCRFVLVFVQQVLISNYAIAKAVFFRPLEMIRPNFITYDITGLTQWEILILSHLITLTPGTTSVDIEDDFKTLIIHVFDVEDPDVVRRQIDRGLKKPMLAFTR